MPVNNSYYAIGKLSIKKKHSFYGIFHKGGGLPLFHNVFFEKNIFFQNMFKDAQKLLIHPEM